MKFMFKNNASVQKVETRAVQRHLHSAPTNAKKGKKKKKKKPWKNQNKQLESSRCHNDNPQPLDLNLKITKLTTI